MSRFSATALAASLFISPAVVADKVTYDDIREMTESFEERASNYASDTLGGIDVDDIMNRAKSRRDEAKKVFQNASRNSTDANESTDQAPDKYSNVDTIYFVSWSMGEESLVDVFHSANNAPDTSIVVIQGVAPGAKLPAGLNRYYEILKDEDVNISFVLDPSLFDYFQISMVPTIVKLNEKGDYEAGRYLAKVSGQSTDAHIKEQISKGQSGDLGVRGDAVEISEPNLIDVMKEKMLLVDWDKQKDNAVNNFWKNQDYNKLPPALNDRLREIDPSIILTAPIKDNDGVVIVEKGTIVNPLDKLPFQRKLIVFNPARSVEMNYVLNLIEDTSFKEGRIVLIASEFQASDGWDWYENTTEDLNMPRYKLTEDIMSRWEVEYTPTIITADEDTFFVEEISLSEYNQSGES